MHLWDLLYVYDSVSQWICDCFNQTNKPLNIDTIWSYKVVKFVSRDPSLEENTNFFLKWFCCYLEVYLLQPGYILSANKLAPLPGTKVLICPGRTTKIKRDFCGQTGISRRKEGCIFALATSL